MTCPHCRRKIPNRAVVSAAARINRARVGVANPGRKRVMRTCPRCGQKHSAREMRQCKSPRKEKARCSAY